MYKWVRYITAILIVHAVLLTAHAQYTNDETVEAPPAEAIEQQTPFSVITTQDPVEIKKLPQEKVDELKKDENYWYANIAPERPKEKKQTPASSDDLFEKNWFQNLLWIIIVCSFIAVVIWYLASSNINLFRKESKKIADDETEEEVTDDIFSISYEKEIQKAVGLQNYRLAVRLWYLRTLKEMSVRNMIDYTYGKTNQHYVNALHGSRFYETFFRLTRNFEYTWYGQFKPSATAYEAMEADFIKFKNSLA